ncbi:MAG: hypothetical protein ACN6O6_21390 [Pseudomonas sp.]|uniref:hypothetical protein n=1 Tax=Pseudomonas sp. TaxID=306 RepID=UPI003D0EC7F5
MTKYIPIPDEIEQAVKALVRSMYKDYKPEWISLTATSKSPYGGTGSFMSGTFNHSIVWSHDKRPYIAHGPGD